MIKYRVIKAVNGYGETTYVPQHRRMFLWRNMGIRYNDLTNAIAHIRRNVYKKEKVVFEMKND